MTATIDDVRQELEDLAAWRSGLSDAVDTILGVSSPRLSTDGRGSSSGMALPFHLDRAVDEPDLGGAGVRTEAGLLDLVGSWARSIAHDRGEHVKGSPLTYLHTTLAWAQQHADWYGLAGDVHDAWVAVGRIVGHGDQVIADCPVPKCGGKIVADHRDENGISDFGHCNICDIPVHTDRDGFGEDALRIARDPNVHPLASVTLAEALRVWPELTRDDIRNWTRHHKLAPILRIDGEASRYPLHVVNKLALELLAKRQRPGWGHANTQVAMQRGA